MMKAGEWEWRNAYEGVKEKQDGSRNVPEEPGERESYDNK